MKEFIYLNKASTADRVISFDQIWRKTQNLSSTGANGISRYDFAVLLPLARGSACNPAMRFLLRHEQRLRVYLTGDKNRVEFLGLEGPANVLKVVNHCLKSQLFV